MLKISFAGSRDLSPVILTQVTLEMCVAASNREKKSLKTPIWGFKVVEGQSAMPPSALTNSARPCTSQILVFGKPTKHS